MKEIKYKQAQIPAGHVEVRMRGSAKGGGDMSFKVITTVTVAAQAIAWIASQQSKKTKK